MSVAASLRVRLAATDMVRRQGLAAMIRAGGHEIVDDTPDVALFDVGEKADESEAPALVLTKDGVVAGSPAGVLLSNLTAEQLDLAIRTVAAGLLVRSPSLPADRGFAPLAEETPLLTPREREILTLVGHGMSNKMVARQLGISVHTVKFHLEALFDKLEATSRAEAVAKGLVGRVIEL